MGKRPKICAKRSNRKATTAKKKLDQFYQDKLNAQIELSKNLSRISPSASFTYATTDLAHTGIGLFTSFKRGYNRFQDEFGTWANEWDDTYHNNDEKYPDENWLQADTLPTFKMHKQRLDDAIEAALMDILLLLVFNVLFFMLSYLFFLRYDVT